MWFYLIDDLFRIYKKNDAFLYTIIDPYYLRMLEKKGCVFKKRHYEICFNKYIRQKINQGYQGYRGYFHPNTTTQIKYFLQKGLRINTKIMKHNILPIHLKKLITEYGYQLQKRDRPTVQYHFSHFNLRHIKLLLAFYPDTNYIYQTHYKNIKKEYDEFNKSKNKKKILYNTYRSIIDPTYVSVEEDSVNEENYCYQCKTFRVTISEEAIMACPRCGCQVTVTQKYTKPSANDPPTENKTCDYQRYSHFCNWIDKIQGKETLIIPEQIIKSVKREIKKERKCDSLNKLTENDIRNYLKKNKKYKDEKYDHFYDHSTKILWIVTGIRPIQMTPEMESNLQSLFMAIQEPFEMYKQDRNNFSSYSYILYKFCQLLGYKAFLHKLRLHKNEALIYKHDCIWKKICEYMGGEEKGWVFIKTYLY